jgi:hypothetical protein
MKNSLFLIFVIILVLLLIQRSSSKMPVSKRSNAVSVGLPELDNLVKNVLSNTQQSQLP